MKKETVVAYANESLITLKGTCELFKGMLGYSVSVYFRTDDICKRRPYTMSPCLRFDGKKVQWPLPKFFRK
jgi:hypothetical protein